MQGAYLGVGNLSSNHLLLPGLGEEGTELLVERPAVRQEPGTEEHVTHQALQGGNTYHRVTHEALQGGNTYHRSSTRHYTLYGGQKYQNEVFIIIY